MFTDPVLNLFNAVELNYLIFGIIYGAILYGLYRLSSYPEILLSAIQTYVLMVFFRMAVMYVVPLEQPAGVIDLKDPLVFIFGTGQKITKDLFFSGHTATLFILFLNAPLNKLKYLFLVCTIIVGTCVLIQKAHYTIDVLAAPAFAYCSYSIIKKINP